MSNGGGIVAGTASECGWGACGARACDGASQLLAKQERAEGTTFKLASTQTGWT